MKEINIKIKEDYLPAFLATIEQMPKDKIQIQMKQDDSPNQKAIKKILSLLEDEEIKAVFERLKNK